MGGVEASSDSFSGPSLAMEPITHLSTDFFFFDCRMAFEGRAFSLGFMAQATYSVATCLRPVASSVKCFKW